MQRDVTENSVEKLKELMSTADWNLITQNLNPNNSYKFLLTSFVKIYNEAFALRKIKMKTKNIASPWITAGTRNHQGRNTAFAKRFSKAKSYKNVRNNIRIYLKT